MKRLKWILFVAAFLFLVAFENAQSLHVTSFPDGANVFIYGKDSGKVTPMSVAMTPGQHAVKVQLLGSAGWNTDTRTVDTYSGDVHLSVTLLPTLTSVPPGPQGIPVPASTLTRPQGPQGIPGLNIVGPQGLAGAQGLKGDTGATGAT